MLYERYGTRATVTETGLQKLCHEPVMGDLAMCALTAKRTVCAALLAAALMPLAAPNAGATTLPSTPLQVGDTAFSFIAIYPFGGQPQVQFAPISPGQLNFSLDLIGVDPALLDDAFIEVRMDIGVQGNTQYVNIGGPVQAGTDDEGLLVGGTLQLFDITKWSFAVDGTPIALSYFAELSPGVQGTLSIDFVSNTPVPAALPLFASGLGVIGFLTKRRKRKQAALAAA
jgi:hypothetical protein